MTALWVDILYIKLFSMFTLGGFFTLKMSGIIFFLLKFETRQLNSKIL